jgi:hypothetical protein
MTADTVQIEVQQTAKSRLQEVDFDNLVFGRNISDHMFIAEYREGQWHDPAHRPLRRPLAEPCHSGATLRSGYFRGYESLQK